MSEQHEAVAVEVHEAGWAELILNRPERKNAITGPLGEAMAAAMHELNANDDVRVILLRGAGGGSAHLARRSQIPVRKP